LNFSRCPLVAI